MNVHAIENAALNALRDEDRVRLDGKGLDKNSIGYIAKAIARAIEEYDRQRQQSEK